MQEKPQRKTKRKSKYTVEKEIFETLGRLEMALECEDCSNFMGEETTCPFMEEIHHTIEYITVCEKCLWERAADI